MDQPKSLMADCGYRERRDARKVNIFCYKSNLIGVTNNLSEDMK